MKCKFLNSSKFSAILSDSAAAPSSYCHYVGLQLDLLSPYSSYVEISAAGCIWSYIVVGRRRRKATAVQCHHNQKAALFVTKF